MVLFLESPEMASGPSGMLSITTKEDTATAGAASEPSQSEKGHFCSLEIIHPGGNCSVPPLPSASTTPVTMTPVHRTHLVPASVCNSSLPLPMKGVRFDL